MTYARPFGATRAPIAVLTLSTFLFGLAPIRRAHAQEGPQDEAAPAREQAADERGTSASLGREERAMARPSEAEDTTSPGALRVAPARGGDVGRASIDARAVSAMAATAGGEVSSGALALPGGAGKVGGMGEGFGPLLSTGTATFSIPIPLVPARGGAQPNLSLTYSSSAGNGVAGIGWSVGVPFIARDTTQGPPTYRTGNGPGDDRFTFNGGELLPICTVSPGLACAAAIPGEVMPAWSAGWRYFRPRIEQGFQRFFWSPDGRTWRLQDKTGLQAELGLPLDASGDTSAIESAPDDPARIFRWNVARQYDVHGAGDPLGDAAPRPYNVVVYRYMNDGGVAYPSDIYDTPPAGTTAAPLARYAHHAHLTWESRLDSLRTYRRGWLVTQSKRLAGVDVTSMPFAGGTTRLLVRRVHFAYDPGYRISLLTSVTEEGRCSGDEASGVPAEQADGTLPATSCPTLPPTTLGYTHVTNASGEIVRPTVAGFEGFSTAARTIANAPNVSMGDGFSTFIDLNADGLPDVLNTSTTNAQAPGKHVVFLNAAGAAIDRFGGPVPMGLPVASSGLNIGNLNFTNTSVLPLDLDGNGAVDLTSLPFAAAPELFAAKVTASAASWTRSRPITSASLFPRLNLGVNRARTNVLDVNGDGAVDIVYTGDNGIQTYFSLSPWPGGNGAFGSATPEGGSVTLSATPVSACVPSATTAVTFADPNVQVADMNGDGLADLVRVKNGEVLYWPGRGDGHWGTGDPSACTFGRAVSNLHVAMTGAPVLSSLKGLQLADVNGDGLSDLIQLGSSAALLWLNTDGAGFTASATIPAPVVTASPARIRLLDIDGSGTADIVWAEPGSFRYVDLLGGTRPWLLRSVANGYGKTTEVTYGTSTSEMLAAASAGHPWSATIPSVVHVVKSMTTNDHLDAAGRKAGSYRTEYTYRDPAYDGRRRDFRGFRSATATAIGDASHTARITETQFLTGDCVDEDASGRCAANARSLDNPRDALKGLPSVVEVRDANGVVLSTAHTTYRLRRLYASLDGREVRHAFASHVDVFRYDTGPFVASPEGALLTDVEVERAPGIVTSDPATTVTLASTRGRVRNAMAADFDAFGNALQSIDAGCVEGCAADEVITSVSVPRLLGDASGWSWRTVESWISGSNAPSELRQHKLMTYDALGRPSRTTAELRGSLPLVRAHEVGGAKIAPPPATASKDGMIELGAVQHDAYGNVTRTTTAGSSCDETDYDAAYAELPVAATAFVGAAGPDGCGVVQLATTAQYDRGLRAITERTGPNGEVGRARYDAFGRVIATYAPDPVAVGRVSSRPTRTYEYLITADATRRPWSLVHTQSQAGATADDATVHHSWSFFDAIGRGLVRLEQADPAKGDGGAWLVSDFVDYDAQGGIFHVHRPWFWTGDPQSFPLGSAPTRAAVKQKDAFDREVDVHDADGSWAKHVVFHAISQDVWDAGHLGDVPGASYVTVTQDGHGRAITTLERFASGGVMDARLTQVSYLPTGEPFVFTRSHATGGDAPIVRWLRYDTLGRLVLNVEADTSVGFDPDPNASADAVRALRYAHDDAGRTVGTSDARGCGENFFFDAGGRLVAEDYSPCTASQAPYSEPDLATGDGTEAFHRYDSPDPEQGATGCPATDTSRGRLTSSSTRGAKDIVSFDGRGRTTCAARQLAVPGAPSAILAARYAPRWYARSTAYDGADRAVRSTTGARSPELLAAGGSAVTIDYAASGAPYGVGSTYGPLVRSMVHDAEGAPVTTTYGDVASTRTQLTYDAHHRRATAYTSRSAPALWSAPVSGYVPPSTPATTQQLVLENAAFAYDRAGNPIELIDLRNADEWPAGAKPVSRSITYDDLYRAVAVRYAYPAGADTWTSPFEAEDHAAPGTEGGARPSPHVSFEERLHREAFAFDWKGNTVSTDDDAHAFYDRSLGTIANGSAGAGPYQLRSASNRAAPGVSSRAGDLSAAYDASGELTGLVVRRDGPCLPEGASCWQRFAYSWDEVGHLAQALRWDLAEPERTTASDLDRDLPARAPDVRLAYTYTDSAERTLKTATDARGREVHTAYIFPSLELRRTTFDATAGDYVVDASTETVRLLGFQGPVARVVYAPEDAPTATSGRQHVFLELPDHLGTATTILDRDTSELVERGTYASYGAEESDYRPERWKGFREELRFTGKEDDIEVGLHYFGARYYSALLGRWASPDPLALQSPGAEDDNVYAYGRGRVFAGADPDGRFFVIDDALEAMAIGALVGMVVDAGVQGIACWQDPSRKFDWGELGRAGVGGAVAGLTAVVGGAALAAPIAEGGAPTLFGSKLLASGVINGASSVAGTAAQEALTPPSQRNGTGIVAAGITGTIMGLLFHGAGAAGTRAGSAGGRRRRRWRWRRWRRGWWRQHRCIAGRRLGAGRRRGDR
jgi:RHS repeat-associated protein